MGFDAVRAAGFPTLLLVLAGCLSSHPPFPQERSALVLPEAIDPWWVTVSPGGHGAAYAERQGSDAYLVFDGRRLGPYP